jgi:hypothetical protein
MQTQPKTQTQLLWRLFSDYLPCRVSRCCIAKPGMVQLSLDSCINSSPPLDLDAVSPALFASVPCPVPTSSQTQQSPLRESRRGEQHFPVSPACCRWTCFLWRRSGASSSSKLRRFARFLCTFGPAQRLIIPSSSLGLLCVETIDANPSQTQTWLLALLAFLCLTVALRNVWTSHC